MSSSDEEKESTGRDRVLQRRGRARVRELVKMAESMPEEAKRPSALETNSVTRKTSEVFATSVREFHDWSGLWADRNVFGSGQTSHGVHELLPGIFTGCVARAEGGWSGDLPSAGCEDLENL